MIILPSLRPISIMSRRMINRSTLQGVLNPNTKLQVLVQTEREIKYTDFYIDFKSSPTALTADMKSRLLHCIINCPPPIAVDRRFYRHRGASLLNVIGNDWGFQRLWKDALAQ